MILHDNPTMGRPQRHVIRSMIVAVLALAAILLGSFTVHCACAGHEMNGTLPAASAHAEHDTGANGMTANAVEMVAVASHVNVGWLTLGGNLMAGCALMGMACSVLLVLASLLLLARQPSAYKRLLDAGGFVVDSFRSIPLHIHRPSLTLLSISRT